MTFRRSAPVILVCAGIAAMLTGWVMAGDPFGTEDSGTVFLCGMSAFVLGVCTWSKDW